MKVYGEDKKVSEKKLNNVLGTTVTDPYGDGKHYLAPMFYAQQDYSTTKRYSNLKVGKFQKICLV